MRRTVSVLLAGLVLVSYAGLARAQDAKAIVDKAIKAMGGEEKLAKYKATTTKEKGTYYGMGAGLPYTADYAIELPYRTRMEVAGYFTSVFDKDKGWMKMGNDTTEMSKEQVAQRQEEQYCSWLTTLLPLKDKNITLTMLGESKVGDRPAVGIKASSKGHRDVKIYFDKENGRPLKSEFMVQDETQGGKEVNQEAFYESYKEVNGVQVPMKMKIQREGKLFVEGEVLEVKLAEKLPDSLFAKP
jgi:hypothetical protein